MHSKTRQVSKFTETKISYSERVYIDITRILAAADKETTGIIWKHLLTISALVDPTVKARQILKAAAQKGSGPVSEANFLSDIIGKVEGACRPRGQSYGGGSVYHEVWCFR